MIIGTAGHIDHGKTTLVRALSGVDTDRLPEEKRRGISIELGYAYPATANGASLGYVDVPGHERLLHTMLAGATGIDHALLLVAADDGVMPQTREHLAVIALLGLPAGTVAMTKCDRVDAARRAAVRGEIAALVAGTPLAAAPVFEVSASSGEGIAALRAHLEAAAADPARAFDAAQGFRLVVDRAFTLTGAGTVVTGMVQAGAVRVGDELQLMPGGRAVRVRSLRVHDAEATEARAGQRAALALAGVAKDEVHRGDVAATPSIALASARLDVALTLWHDEVKPLRSGTPVHVHLGASDVMGSVALLDRDALAPGETGLAQLVLHQPVAAWHGDRGVLRDGSATRTLAGLRVLDPLAPSRYRRTPERLALLQAWSRPTLEARVAALVEASPGGLDLAVAARVLGRAAPGDGSGPPALPLPADAVRLDDRHAPQALPAAGWQALREAIVAALERLHAAEPEAVGPDTRRLKRLVAPRGAEPVWRAAVAAGLADGSLAQSGAWLHLPAHAVRLSAAEEKLAQQLLPPMTDGGYDPPWVRDLARTIAAPEALVRLTLARLAQRGQVYPIVRDLYYPAPTVERLAALLREAAHASAPAGVPAAVFRDATGLGRKRAIQILEFFDRVGYTRRVKDTHVLRSDTTLFGGTPPG